MLNKDALAQRLDAAAAAGLIQPAQVAPLADFLARDDSAPQAAVSATISGEEDLRFVRNFHDVFLATGIILLAIGLSIAVVTAAGGFEAPMLITTAVLFGGCAFIMEALGEVFSKQRRLFLPSIAICVSFVAFCVYAAMSAYGFFAGQRIDIFNEGLSEAAAIARGAAPVAAAAAVAACAFFYLRFRLPFSMGLLGLGATFFVVALIFWLSPSFLHEISSALWLLGGLGMFAAGVWFDARDPARATRISDNGFWLHLGAAPLILNGVLTLVGGGMVGIIQRSEAGSAVVAAIVTLFVVAVLGLTSLLINRRALIVSALLSTGAAVGALMNAVGLDAGVLAASTLVVLGGGVLILGAGWHTARRALLKHAPQTGVWARIFPPETSLEGAPRTVATA